MIKLIKMAISLTLSSALRLAKTHGALHVQGVIVDVKLKQDPTG